MGRTETAWGPWDPAAPTDVASLFGELAVSWWIAGGYAIELACRRRVRDHADIDVAVLRRDQLAVQELLADWEWWAADPPGTLRRWEPGEILPIGVHDIWCRPAGNRPWTLQLMLEESYGDLWVSRRDPRVRRPIARIGDCGESGIPYLAPEVQLYYKAEDIRPKDTIDFDAVVPFLDQAQRDWLTGALAPTHGGEHAWRQKLRG